MFIHNCLTMFSAFYRKLVKRCDVSVLIPVYDAQDFIVETLDSVKQQTYQDVKISISIDKSNDASACVVKRWCEENKQIYTKIFIQNHRLGWVKNTNFLLKRCRTRFFMVLPHDDLLGKNYIQKTYECLTANEEASAAYSDIQAFGMSSSVLHQDSIIGSQNDRMKEFLLNHYKAVAFRGLVNRTVLSELLLLPETQDDNFSMDTVWTFQLAIKGALIRIAEPLYKKRYLEASAHASWQAWGRDEAIDAWYRHCKDCQNIATQYFSEDTKQPELRAILQSRLLQSSRPLWKHDLISQLGKNEKDGLINRFFSNGKSVH